MGEFVPTNDLRRTKRALSLSSDPQRTPNDAPGMIHGAPLLLTLLIGMPGRDRQRRRRDAQETQWVGMFCDGTLRAGDDMERFCLNFSFCNIITDKGSGFRSWVDRILSRGGLRRKKDRQCNGMALLLNRNSIRDICANHHCYQIKFWGGWVKGQKQQQQQKKTPFTGCMSSPSSWLWLRMTIDCVFANNFLCRPVIQLRFPRLGWLFQVCWPKKFPKANLIFYNVRYTYVAVFEFVRKLNKYLCIYLSIDLMYHMQP